MFRASIKWIMLVSGVLTCTMVYAAIAPQAMLRSRFGESLEGPLADLIVRNWGALIFLIGAMLILVRSISPPGQSRWSWPRPASRSSSP